MGSLRNRRFRSGGKDPERRPDFQHVKVFHEPGQLKRQLQDLGWDGSIGTSGRFFYYGCVSPAGAGQQTRARRHALIFGINLS